MTPLVLTSCRIFAGGVDLTDYSNKLELGAEVEEKKTTTFLPHTDPDCGWEKVIGGIASGAVKGGGNWQAGGASIQDDAIWALLGSSDVALSAYPVDAEVASLGYFTKTLVKSYQFLGAVGDVNPWMVDDVSAWPVVRGASLHPPGTARTATGNGTGVQLGAVSSTQKMYAALHVLSVSGSATPTITVKLQSDSDNTWASPTDQLTFSAATAIGGQISRVAGAITDTWWRASWTISGTTPSFLFVVSAGIAV